MNIRFNASDMVVPTFGAVPNADVPKAGVPPDSRAVSSSSSSVLDPLLGSEPVTKVPDGALRRDDALGRLVSAAFCLPPPPMPAFPS